jgi:hypothetical protein
MATSAAESLKQTESLFAKNHEPFFNSIGPKRRKTMSALTSGFGGKDGVIGRQLVDS